MRVKESKPSNLAWSDIFLKIIYFVLFQFHLFCTFPVLFILYFPNLILLLLIFYDFNLTFSMIFIWYFLQFLQASYTIIPSSLVINSVKVSCSIFVPQLCALRCSWMLQGWWRLVGVIATDDITSLRSKTQLQNRKTLLRTK